MKTPNISSGNDLIEFFKNFSLETGPNLLERSSGNKTQLEFLEIEDIKIPKLINEFWTAKQRQASSLHEITYRACFKGQLPRFFINLLTNENDTVYDPFNGRGTTVIEAALLGRNVVANDINPISKIFSYPRLKIPLIADLEKRLNQIPVDKNDKADLDLTMFYHPETELEIVSLKNYLRHKKENNTEDYLDFWLRMVATNRLTGHSPGFFSVYTLPPNQAVSQESQRKINKKRDQIPEYRDTKKLIIKKSKSLVRNVTEQKRKKLFEIAQNSLFLTKDARDTGEIKSDSIQLTVTSPPFLNIVQYAVDNWLRCWFNGIDLEQIAENITMVRSIKNWTSVMGSVFRELFRITKTGGWVAFEVGEIRNGKVKLEEHVIPLGINAGFSCKAVLINWQSFTKTSNIWGITNNKRGTNSNRIVIFKKK